MPSSSTLPLEARQAAWRALWAILLAPVPDEETESVPEPTEPAESTDEAA
jgi:hypothetical protein